jgi:FtsP/CotA-like multicopper oxidase with cupredoxin domain
VPAGRYYLATTAATYNGIAAAGPSISVTAGQDLRVDINPAIK